MDDLVRHFSLGSNDSAQTGPQGSSAAGRAERGLAEAILVIPVPDKPTGGIESFSWGGEVVWKDGLQEEVPSLGAVLEKLGSSSQQAEYVENSLHPLLIDMVCEAISSAPEDPALFCLRWLLNFLGAPEVLILPLVKWAEARRKDKAEELEKDKAEELEDAQETEEDKDSSDFGEEKEAEPEKVQAEPERHMEATRSLSDAGEGPAQARRTSALKKPGGERKANSRPATSFCENGPEVLQHVIAAATQAAPLALPEAVRRRRPSVRVVNTQREEVEHLLASVPYFRDLDESDRKMVATACTVRQFDAHAEIVRYGEVCSDIYVVMSGNCRVSVPEFKQTLHPGECFNEAALLKGEVAAEAMLAAAPNMDVTLLSVSVKDMEAMGVWKKILRKSKKTSDSHYIARPAMQGSADRGDMAMSLASRNYEVPHQELSFTEEAVDTEKSEQDLEVIQLAVGRNQLTELLHLSNEQIQELASCMYLRHFPPNSIVIKKGDRGEHFYVVREGLCELISHPDPGNPAKNAPGTVAIRFHAGSSFGELALLYNCQRKATIISVRQTSLWVLDLTGWRNVLSKMPSSRLEIYQGLLSAVPELCEAVPQVEKRGAIADCLEEVYYQNGEVVAVEGTIGILHIVLEGTCGANVAGHRVGNLGKGAYFGAGSLFKGTPYAETIFVTSEHATILQLDRETCKHLNLKITFEDAVLPSDSPGKVVASRRRSIMHKAAHEASAVSLNRLDCNRLEIPQTRLEPLGILGTGAFAVVSLVHDPATEKLYALKAMSKQAIIEQSLKNMVVTERNSLAELGDSPFVVKLLTTYKDEDCIYLLQEPALGGELFALYSQNDWYGCEEKATFFTICVAIGIDYIHSKKIIHRDIKLENILLDEKGYARITDLGISKVVIGKTYTVCGTADYLAPETLKQQGHNRAVDWWALGVLTFAMMIGRMPFDAEDVLQIYKNIVKGFRKEHFPSTCSADFVDFVKSLCKKKPQERITMLPGGIKNLAKHPWLMRSDDPQKWVKIDVLKYPAPWAPPQLEMPERRASLKQSHSAAPFAKYVDDGTDWDDPF